MKEGGIGERARKRKREKGKEEKAGQIGEKV